MTIDQNQINDVIGKDVYGLENEHIGKVGQVYLDDATGRPDWLTVKTGLFGMKESFVPLSQAQVSGDRLDVPYTKDVVKDAPRVDAESHLDPEDEDQLYRHYGLDDQSAGGLQGESGTTDHLGGRDVEGGLVGTPAERSSDLRTDHDGTDRVGTQAGTVGGDTTGLTAGEAGTRSEEPFPAGTEQREPGRSRLRRHVTTEQGTHGAAGVPGAADGELRPERTTTDGELRPESTTADGELRPERTTTDGELRPERTTTDGVDGVDGTDGRRTL
ncbi:PRC-barrel domain-containing protein [Luteipulveratus flavus]|uniref:PRC-barrel domain-containing protein n=1 Tax=Luteipulveratus flavus TaxID=3031728 RepID=A0ABT6CDC8_9MICO|nr:PRC-barrel domain-containing protein [Luteipulveratus sp. YIM 133296]MDF8266518.1 PRC-barrel domain-containing protein [Luteipulveratus sp. YIM 133296]